MDLRSKRHKMARIYNTHNGNLFNLVWQEMQKNGGWKQGFTLNCHGNLMHFLHEKYWESSIIETKGQVNDYSVSVDFKVCAITMLLGEFTCEITYLDVEKVN